MPNTIEPRRTRAPSTFDLLNNNDAAAYLGVSPATLNTWRCQRSATTSRKSKSVHIPYCKVGRLVAYRRADLDAFIAAHVVATP